MEHKVVNIIGSKSKGTLTSIKRYLGSFRRHGDWRIGLLENCDPQVLLKTPLGELHGIDGINLFLKVLDDALLGATAQVQKFTRRSRSVDFSWVASGLNSEITDGTSHLEIKNGKIVKLDIQCTLTPLVLNQG